MAKPNEKQAAKQEPEQKPGTAVTTAAAGGAMAIPDFMKGHEGEGTEKIGLNDVAVPRIKLMQSNSPELETFPGVTRGAFFHTLLEDVVGMNVNDAVAWEIARREAKKGSRLAPDEMAKINNKFIWQLRVVVLYTDLRYILWNPRDSGGGILARADDGVHWNPPNVPFNVTLDKKMGGKQVTWTTKSTVAQSGLANWGTMDPGDPKSQPAATKMFNVVCAMPDHQDLPPVVVSLQRSAVSVGSKLIGKLKITRAPSYGLIFKMQSWMDSNGTDQFFNYNFIMDDFEPLITDEALFRQYADQYKFFAEQGLTVKDIEGLQDDPTPDKSGGGAAPRAPQGAPAF